MSKIRKKIWRNTKFNQEEINIILNKAGFVPNTDWIYINCDTPISGTWLKCKHNTSPRLIEIKNKGYGCKFCANRIDGGNGLNVYFNNLKNRCKNKNLEFLLTKEQVKSIITKNCCLCGAKPNMTPALIHTVKRKHKQKYTDDLLKDLTEHAMQFKCNSLDRIDSSKGYIIENVQSLCNECNKRKSDSTDKEFIEHCTRIVNFQFTKNE